MRLKDVEIGRSPLQNGFTRVTGYIAVESKGHVLSYWFDIPADLDPALSDSGNAWGVLMLPLACYFGETVVIDRPLDRVLHDNLLGLRSVWSAWYPKVKPVTIEAHTLVGIDRREIAIDPSKKTIACFSGGIDSLFTFFRHKGQVLGDGTAPIDDVLCIGGFNTPMDDFDQMQTELEAFATRFGRRLVPVLTNIRYGGHAIETPYSIGPWMEHLAHAAFMASIVHMLGRRYKEFIIPASTPYDHLQPWGSHPMCDRLLSASDLRVVHDGASFSRIARTETIACHDEALAILQVCARNDRRQGNCSRCQKCLRTMATLDLLSAKDRARTFDWSNYSMAQLRRVWLPTWNEQLYFLEIAERAERDGRSDMAAAARASLAFSRRKRVALDLINSNPISRTAWRGVRIIRQATRVGKKHPRALATPTSE
jgi:hypothetical protein